MVYEIVTQTIDPTRREEYLDVYRRAFRDAGFAGFRGGKVCPSLEDPARVVLIIEWDSVEAHKQHVGTPAHNRFREAIRDYQTAPSEIQHHAVQDL